MYVHFTKRVIILNVMTYNLRQSNLSYNGGKTIYIISTADDDYGNANTQYSETKLDTGKN